MRKILGIDTGGTYTDGVIVAAGTREILCKTKTLTTHRNLRLCINNCIHAFRPDQLEGVSLVCLSTTLATNAIVEGRGCKEGLILIGGRPEGKMPSSRYRVIRGKPDIRGRMRENIDPNEVDEAIESFRGEVDALAVSGYASVRNPEHEIYVKQRIQQRLGVPVVCAHDLTGSLGFYDRTVTATLNARLIPLLCELIDSVRQVMLGHQIEAPLMIVRGDGTLMTAECARDKPIETILSGPAASIIGGVFLSGETNPIVLDMGGTTTDLANVEEGRMLMNNDGAKVGGWFTQIRAAEVYTIGLGGDSRVYLDSERRVSVGPQKVIPYCVAATWFPDLLRELQDIYGQEDRPYLNFWRNEIEAFMLARYAEENELSELERQIVRTLDRSPHTLYVLQKQIGVPSLISALERLLAAGYVSRIALSPTDVLHATGAYVEWDAEAARLVLQIMADQLSIRFGECAERVRATIHRLLGCACIQSGLYFDRQDFDASSSEAADYFVNRIFLNDQSPVLGGHYYLKKPVVAIGAPTGAWVGTLAETLGTRVIVPPYAEVANAVGAAVGQATEQVEILIRPDPITKTYTVFGSQKRLSEPTLDQATDCARRLGAEQAAAYLPGAFFDLTDRVEDVEVADRYTGQTRFVERRVIITAVSHLTARNNVHS